MVKKWGYYFIVTLQNLLTPKKRIWSVSLQCIEKIKLVERSSTDAIPTVISQYHSHHHPPRGKALIPR